MNILKQVDKSHYISGSYLHSSRFGSYFYQIKSVLDLKPSSILEVGVGDRVFGNFIKDNTEIKYTSVDVDPDLKPDVVASVTNLPFSEKSFDVVVCFEVLEHLDFDNFKKSLDELLRVSSRDIVISLPHFGPVFKFNFKVPFFSEIKILFKLPWHKKHVFNGQHYWEIGKKGFGLNRVKKIITDSAILVKDFVPFENPYHHFFYIRHK